MNQVDYARIGTDDLIERFIDTANHVGCPIIPFQLKVPYPSSEFTQGKDQIHAIAAELRTRNPTAEVRARILAHESRDVRGWASGQFLSSDPTWAYAAFCSVLYNVSTQEVVAWRDRILNGPPAQPVVQEMTVAQLVQRFIDACGCCYGTTRFLLDEEGGGDSMEAHNLAAGEIHDVAKEMNSRGKLDAFLPLLNHPLMMVRLKAAMYCLKIAPDRASAALEAVDASGERDEAVEAAVILALWRKGKFDAFALRR
jgi:hypothetical protein